MKKASRHALLLATGTALAVACDCAAASIIWEGLDGSRLPGRGRADGANQGATAPAAIEMGALQRCISSDTRFDLASNICVRLNIGLDFVSRIQGRQPHSVINQ